MHIKLKEYWKDKLFFASDPHFGHKNIIKYCDRPFMDEKEMNENLVSKWNAKVPKNAIVFLLGDVSMRDDIAERMLAKLNGTIILVKGNHDKPSLVNSINSVSRSYLLANHSDTVIWRDTSSMIELVDLHVVDNDIDDMGMRFALCHYPMGSWNHLGRGAVNLYGHVHSGKTYDTHYKPNENQYDVGVDNNYYAPVSYNELILHFTKKFLRDS